MIKQIFIILSLTIAFGCAAAQIEETGTDAGTPGVVQGSIDERVPQSLETSPLVILAGDRQLEFTVELADDREEQQIGLMFRDELADDAGMLFDYGAPSLIGMFMKNTRIPLDMLFLDRSGRIVSITENAQPGSLRSITPGMPVSGVLELKGGTVKRLSIAAGDTVVHPIFGNVPDAPAPAGEDN